jgi:hypothetical protein
LENCLVAKAPFAAFTYKDILSLCSLILNKRECQNVLESSILNMIPAELRSESLESIRQSSLLPKHIAIERWAGQSLQAER